MDDINGYNCTCDPGYEGTDCDTGMAEINSLIIISSNMMRVPQNQGSGVINIDIFVYLSPVQMFAHWKHLQHLCWLTWYEKYVSHTAIVE